METTPSRPYEALWQGIWEIEKELDLFQRKIGSVYYWPLFRGPVAQYLAEALGLHEPTGNSVARWRMQRGMAALPQSVTRFARFEQADSILVPFARKPAPGRVDAHSARLLLEPEFGQFLILDNGSRAISDPSVVSSRVHNWDVERLRARILAAFTFGLFLSEARREVADVSASILKRFQRDCGLSPVALAHRCAAFEHGLASSREVLAQTAARRIFIVGRSSAPELLAAATELGIPSIELQHGVIAKFNPHYHYPVRKRIPYAPDWLLTFGSMWQQEVELPAQTRAAIIGLPKFPQPEAMAGANSALVLSQWVIGPQLANAVRALAKTSPGWDIVYRPHPLEGAMVYRKIFSDCHNVRISNDKPLAAQFSKSSVQLGVYSTALYEGMAAGLRTILFDLPGIEHMDTCLQRGDAILATQPKDAAKLLATAPRANDTSFYMTPAVSIAAALNIA